LNVGLPPEEGKYNRTACTRCYKKFSLVNADNLKWRCECGGVIKKGVFDRVRELADLETPRHPSHRPPYLHLIPLSEIISLALERGVNTKTVKEVWENLILQFGSEIAVLLDSKPEDIEGLNERVVYAISSFKKGRIILEPGGGGKYGTIKLPEKMETVLSKGQRSLFDSYVDK
jgi:uncharacterized protein (TIGR00375 family)